MKSLLTGARTAAALVRKVESSEALQARFDESAAEVHREVGQVSFAVCRALLAHALGRDPSDDEVNEVLSAAVNDPAFPNRAFRLLGEARKSASRRRRAFLASVLFGLPFSKLPDDERDRIDMAVERLMPADVELLRLIVEKNRTARPTPEKEPFLFRGTRVAAMIRGIEVRIGSTDDYTGTQAFFSNAFYDDPRSSVDHATFAALTSFGLVDIGQSEMQQGGWKIHRLVVTPLGQLVVGAIEEVRAGFDGS